MMELTSCRRGKKKRERTGREEARVKITVVSLRVRVSRGRGGRENEWMNGEKKERINQSVDRKDKTVNQYQSII